MKDNLKKQKIPIIASAKRNKKGKYPRLLKQHNVRKSLIQKEKYSEKEIKQEKSGILHWLKRGRNRVVDVLSKKDLLETQTMIRTKVGEIADWLKTNLSIKSKK
jgi:hypothetical protein